MKDLYTTGEISKLMNIPIKALRLYDSMGILKPFHIDENTHYRYYTYNQFFYIDLIRYMNKSLKVTLEDIKLMLNSSDDYETLLACLSKHKSSVEKKISELQYSNKVITEAINNLKNINNISMDLQIYEQYLMPRYVAIKNVNVSIYDIDLYCRRNEDLFQNGTSVEENAMCYIYKKKDYQPETHDLLVSQIGYFTDKRLKNIEYFNLPEGRYLCCKFRYSEKLSSQVISEILKFANNKGINLSDTAIQLFQRFDLRAKNKYEYEMEIQILEIGINSISL
ncbi:MerR family transcriptional regulator [Clostridium sp. P21]|uniref:MerR family transcriptional regulator n=1 Tax=Clostridium muellerianum TaxID=2716538 RepID=A0A7Y0EH86_9CLOT|nr:MerR family transcriptional regulator [Clostridium muellerianum]NMM63351.1 MerR family transcriptional regulator [Clostridium muellerianum]